VSINPLLGRPRVSAETLVTHRLVSSQGFWSFLARGVTVDGAKTRDPGNSADSVLTVRPGTLMGKITASGKYANSAYGLSTGALTSTGTTLASSAAIATEMVRRVGATGTFKLTGPPTASGTVRTRTATYSAVNTTTGDITIAALGVNEVQTLTFGAAATGGTMRLRVPLANGTMVTTGDITWNATDATWLGNINAALDAATGVVGGIVATGAAPDTALTFTFSGTGYAALPQPTEMISVVTFPTSATAATVVRTATGVDRRFVTASLIQPTDGSETPLTIVPDGYGLLIPSDSADIDWPLVPIGGVIDFAQTLPLVSDASLAAWVKSALSTIPGGKFTFSDTY
jgi:hypothetical protein